MREEGGERRGGDALDPNLGAVIVGGVLCHLYEDPLPVDVHAVHLPDRVFLRPRGGRHHAAAAAAGNERIVVVGAPWGVRDRGEGS